MNELSTNQANLKHSSSVYKIQIYVYGSICYFFCAVTMILITKLFLKSGIDAPLFKIAPLPTILCLGAVIFYVLFSKAIKNHEVALILESNIFK